MTRFIRGSAKYALIICPLALFTISCGEEGSTPWHLFGKNGINIKGAWQITKGSSDVRIAVVDMGFLADSPAFAGCIDRFKIFDFVRGQVEEGHHGTGVTSLISTCQNNPLGLIGINENSPITFLKHKPDLRVGAQLLSWAAGVFDCTDKTLIDCPARNARPAHVINASWGTPREPTAAELIALRKGALDQVEQINQAGSILVASAGNEDTSADTHFPSSLTGIISAGSSDEDGKVAKKFSNWGETVEIIAPGDNIAMAGKSSVEFASGTSLSSPIVAGVISLMKSVYDELNWKTAIYFLQSTSIALNCDDYCGGRYRCERDCCKDGKQVCTPGRLDAQGAVAAAKRASTEGLPKVALVDSDQYILVLQPGILFNPRKGQFTLKNVGGKAGTYTLTSDNARLMLTPNEVTLAKKGDPGDKITINVGQQHFDTTDQSEVRVRSPESGVAPTFSDELVIHVLKD